MTTDNAKAIDSVSPDANHVSEVREPQAKVHDIRKIPFGWTLIVMFVVCGGIWWGVAELFHAVVK